MASTPRRVASRPIVLATALASAAVLAGQLSAVSQSPSAPVGSGPVGSIAAPVSPAPVDVAAITWKQAKASKGFGPRDGALLVSDMAVGADGRFLLVGVDRDLSPDRKAVVFGSDDGVRWKRLKGALPKGSAAAGVVATPDGFLIVGDVDSSGSLLLTSDGTKVARLDAPADGLPTGRLFGIVLGPDGYVAAGTDAAGAATMWTSPDGRTWVGVPLPEAAYVIHVAVADDGTLVALGNQQDADGNRTPTIWSSVDGVAWTMRPLPVDPGNWSLADLERTPVGLLASLVNQGAGSVWLSPDGVTWTHVLDTSSRAMAGTAGTEAILLGTDAWWHSADGATWQEAAASFDGLSPETSAVRADGAVIAAGFEFTPTSMEGSGWSRTWVGRVPAP